MMRSGVLISAGLALALAACGSSSSSSKDAASTGPDVARDVAASNVAAPDVSSANEVSGSSDVAASVSVDAGKVVTVDVGSDIPFASDGPSSSEVSVPVDAVSSADAPDASVVDAWSEALGVANPTDAANSIDGPFGSSLMLSLDPSIDTDDGDVIATSIMSADLLNPSGKTVASAEISNQTAIFALTGIAAGDYFIQVNGDADDLVPTRIDDPSSNLVQRVGKKLRASYLGPVDKPSYRVNTYSAGQNGSPIIRFSDATVIPGAQPYLILTLGTPKIEFRVLGTAALLTSVTPAATHMMNNAPFDSWLINTDGQEHHGDAYNANGGTATCASCHQNVATKPADFSAITPSSGWCYRCHDGTSGSASGFFDPSK